MKLEYVDLISGDAIYIDSIGHVRSPYLRELKPTTGIGWYKYALYLNLFAWNKKQLLDNAKKLSILGLKALEKAPDNFECFDIMTIIPQTKGLLAEAIAFFMTDDRIGWDDKEKSYIVYNKESKVIGKINRNNFKEFSEIILQLNYVGLSKDKAPSTPKKESCEEALARWEKAQQYLAKQAKTSKSKEESEYSLGNVISKLCAVHHSYNLLNVYDLTIFQLYDQFFQYAYLRSMDLNDRIYSIHGGKEYKTTDWLKNINNN